MPLPGRWCAELGEGKAFLTARLAVTPGFPFGGRVMVLLLVSSPLCAALLLAVLLSGVKERGSAAVKALTLWVLRGAVFMAVTCPRPLLTF